MSVAIRLQDHRWSKIRYQLGGGILLAIVTPTIIRYFFMADQEGLYQLLFTMICSFLAMLLGVWISRSINTYPGVESTSYVVPAISTAYAILLLVLIAGRFPYNRAVLFSGWGISIIWFFVIYSSVQRRQTLRVGIVPPCDANALQGVKGVTTFLLENPEHSPAAVDAVMADLRIPLPSEWDAALADYALSGIPVYHLKHLKESLTGRVELEHISESNFGSLSPRLSVMVTKRIADFLLALCVGVVLLPLLIVVGLAIRGTSPGPALFKQKRMGRRGIPFLVYKFRTMTVEDPSVEARSAAMTQDGDKRITSIGYFLRRTRIDELPQIINILRGEMSWIGPRPEALVLSQWYENEIPFYRYRHIILPGLTGWAQVSQGHVTNVEDVTEKLYYDFYYIKYFSVWLDLLIIIKTVRTVISGYGAR
ncbi:MULTISPECIES: sugar transferase [Sphingomonas]|jgi:lipopolysaccharide/colanic/teichoic acid biosynthesis glycosyltransferase|uniref:sugar transferase n=1 Tax=Sphingomonas TaxID=13687 RepID=UPI0028D299FC|nr:sugar transferase [Sphingomonas paucimobilis]